MLSAEELAGLALDEQVESRVVMGDTAAHDWTLLEGPFTEAFFSDTPERDWTLLVQDVEKHVPALDLLLAPFRFLPEWRRDDLMISYAAPGGTVGPHVDSYDVFLIQAEGTRRWSIQQPAPAGPALRQDGPLRLVRDFTATDAWVLEPGGMLYLPPGIPHYGVALEAALTLSVGFRAPSVSELLDGWARHLVEHPDANPRYADPADQHPTAGPGEISVRDMARLRALMRSPAEVGDELLDDFLGRFLTAPKPAFRSLERASPLDVSELAHALESGRRLVRNPAVRMALVPSTGTTGTAHPRLYVHGIPVYPEPSLLVPTQRLAASGAGAASDLVADFGTRQAQLQALADWYDHGWLWFEDEFTETEDD